ncbi:VUT family protein [Actinokineospora sp. NPDC004072]
MRGALFGLFAGTVLAANLAVSWWGLIPVGFGLAAPAGTFAAGLALIVRDELQARAGWQWALAAVVTGGVLSAVLAGPQLAVASAVAFTVSELVDMAVYSHLGGLRGRLLSNAIGAPIDTVVFLWLSGLGVAGPAVGGQVLVKVLYLAPFAVLAWWLSTRRSGTLPALVTTRS